MISSNKLDRFQYQPWCIKLWRYRHYLPIPYRALSAYLKGDKTRYSFKNCWSICKGIAQYRMNWMYDFDMSSWDGESNENNEEDWEEKQKLKRQQRREKVDALIAKTDKWLEKYKTKEDEDV